MADNLLTQNFTDNVANSISLSANDQNKHMDLLKLDDLIAKYPKLENDLGWSRADIVSFYEGSLLLGDWRSEEGENVLYISENSVNRLIEYLNSLEELKNSLKLPDDSGQF